MKAFLLMFRFYLIVHRSLRNFALGDVLLIISNKGILTFTYLKISKNLGGWFSFFLFLSALGNECCVLYL